jgi:hypothetical protein
MCWPSKLPTSIDLISLDMYCSVMGSKMAACSTDGAFDPAAEAHKWARPFYETQLKPRLLPHQQLLVIPGTFGDWNKTRSPPIEQQQAAIVRKLDAYWAWAQSDPLIAGLNCWHWSTIPGLYEKSPGIIPFYYGVDHMPKVVARLTEIGTTIRSEAMLGAAMTGHGVLKTDDDNGHTGGTTTTVVTCTNISDCTADIQAALSDVSTGHVIIPFNGHVWISRTLVMNRSHVLLTLRPGVILQALRGDFHTPADLILVDGGVNISIVGPGASLRMWRSDYANVSLYTHSEDRMGISSYDTVNLTISDLEIAETGKNGLHTLLNFGAFESTVTMYCVFRWRWNLSEHCD